MSIEPLLQLHLEVPVAGKKFSLTLKSRLWQSLGDAFHVNEFHITEPPPLDMLKSDAQ